MFDWWKPAKLAQSIPLIGRIARMVNYSEPDPAKTTEMGAAGTTTPGIFEFQLLAQRYDRITQLNDIRKLLLDDPRLAKAARKFARQATTGGLRVVVKAKGKHGKREALRAQAIIDDINRDACVNDKVQGWARMLLGEGDLFLQIVVEGKRVVNIKRMPAASMERNTDETDRFPDLACAYSQFDVMMQTTIAKFAYWQIAHARWNHTDGERYGESEFLQCRNIGRLLSLEEQAQVIRRLTRAPQRRLHHVGTPDKPAPPSGPGSIAQYRQQNGLNSNPREIYQPLTQTTDYYGNGLTKIETLPGDPNLDQIDDVKYFQDVLMVGASVPKALIGLDSQGINRDILKDQRGEWLKETTDLGACVVRALKEAWELGLLLAGINPDALEVEARFAESSMEDATDRVERVTKLRQNTLGKGKEAIADPLISRRTALALIGPDIGVENIDAEIKALEEERLERLARGQVEPADPADPAEDEDEDEEEEPEPPKGKGKGKPEPKAPVADDLADRVPAALDVKVVVVAVTDPAGKVLIVRRSPNETRAGEWEVPGGHVDPGESLDVAAIREVREETGLDVLLAERAFVEFPLREGGRGVMVRGHWVGGSIALKLDEHDRFEWVAPESLAYLAGPTPPNFAENVQTVLRPQVAIAPEESRGGLISRSELRAAMKRPEDAETVSGVIASLLAAP